MTSWHETDTPQDLEDLRDRYGYTDADLTILTRVLVRPCPHCGAQAGDWCRTSTGRKIEGLDDQHIERRLWRGGGGSGPSLRYPDGLPDD